LLIVKLLLTKYTSPNFIVRKTSINNNGKPLNVQVVTTVTIRKKFVTRLNLILGYCLHFLLSKYPSFKFIACEININNSEKPLSVQAITRVSHEKNLLLS